MTTARRSAAITRSDAVIVRRDDRGCGRGWEARQRDIAETEIAVDALNHVVRCGARRRAVVSDSYPFQVERC
jgi:hypothetical protein